MTSEMPITQLANTEITLPITLKLNKFQSNILLPAFVLNRVGTVKCSKVFMKFEGSWECSRKQVVSRKYICFFFSFFFSFFFFKFERDVYLINAYVAPLNSSGAKKRDGKEMISKLSEITTELK